MVLPAVFYVGICIACCLFATDAADEGFGRGDEVMFLDKYNDLISDSYQATRPTSLNEKCSGKGAVDFKGSVFSVTAGQSMKASALPSWCGTACALSVEAGGALVMDASLELYSLTVEGSLEWTASTQSATEQWLCAGFAVVQGDGTFELDLADPNKRAYVFITANGARHEVLGERVFGGDASTGGGGSGAGPTLKVSGRPMGRTWSLLSVAGGEGDEEIQLMHDPHAMGWAVGDRLVVYPPLPSFLTSSCFSSALLARQPAIPRAKIALK